MSECPVCWGSHGCDLQAGHDGTVHRCIADPDELEDDPGGPCSEFDGSRARFWLDDGLVGVAGRLERDPRN